MTLRNMPASTNAGAPGGLTPRPGKHSLWAGGPGHAGVEPVEKWISNTWATAAVSPECRTPGQWAWPASMRTVSALGGTRRHGRAHSPTHGGTRSRNATGVEGQGRRVRHERELTSASDPLPRCPPSGIVHYLQRAQPARAPSSMTRPVWPLWLMVHAPRETS